MTTIESDLAVYGATPAGIYAALTAARYGRRVVLCAYGRHVGGLLASGLSIANIRHRHVHGGPFDEFARAVERHYVATYGPDAPQVHECRGGTWWEPHVAEAVFEALLAAEPAIQLIRDVQLVSAQVTAGRVEGFTVRRRTLSAPGERRGMGSSGETVTLRAPVSVDATYEADLAAAAGVSSWVGREGRTEHWEPHAGLINFGVGAGQEVWPGSTGTADARIQAYCFRLAVTQDPARRVPFPPPESYDREDYRSIREAIDAGRVTRLSDVMLLGPNRLRVNGKADVIANLVGGADDYPEGDAATRERIVRRHRGYTLGLFHFLQHEDVVPAAVRAEARSWGLAADEFADNGHFPYELYVREARRIRGRALATEHDFLLEPGAERSPLHHDAIAVADYYLDSHAMQHSSAPPYEEGHLNVSAAQPGQVRFGSLLPESVTGLLVPVAVSSTHAAFSVIRMEPVWMALGAAAATAAHLALQAGMLPHAVPVERVQAELVGRDHRLAFFHDVPLSHRSPGLQFFATKGFFETFHARPHDAVTRFEAARWIARTLELSGLASVAGVTGELTAVPAASLDAFADVLPEQPHFPTIERLRRLGILDGWLESAGFCPSAPLRRIDAHRWMTRAAAHAGVSDAVTPWSGEDSLGGQPYVPVSRTELCDYLFASFTRFLEK